MVRIVLLFRVVQVFRPAHRGASSCTELVFMGLGVHARSRTFSIIATRNLTSASSRTPPINHAGVIAIGLGIGKAGLLWTGALRRQQRLHQGHPLPDGRAR
jgi:hypothetical protein